MAPIAGFRQSVLAILVYLTICAYSFRLRISVFVLFKLLIISTSQLTENNTVILTQIVPMKNLPVTHINRITYHSLA